MSTLTGRQTRLRVLEDFFTAEPSAPRASLPTVVSLFMALAIVQVATLALVIITFDLPGIRTALYFVVAAPAPLYAIIAAWDHRQLSASGQIAIPWAVALVFPPAYLFLRWFRAVRRRRGRTRAAGAMFGRMFALVVVTAPLIVVLSIGVVISPELQADAAADVGISAEESARLLTADGIESAIRSDWAALGTRGSVDCPVVLVTVPGTEISCRATYELRPIVFTIVITEPGPGVRPWEVTSWTTAP